MKTKRTILFRVGMVVFLLIIAGIMMIIGRGHTVYLDNKALDYNGQAFPNAYKIEVIVDGEKIAKLYEKERGMTTCIGQRLNFTLVITQEKGGDEESFDISLALPYNMDGIAINLPAFLAGLPEEAYLSKFEPAPEKEEEASSDDALPTDEFALVEDI